MKTCAFRLISTYGGLDITLFICGNMNCQNVFIIMIYVWLCLSLSFVSNSHKNVMYFALASLRGPFLLTCLTLILAWISNFIHYNVWDVITYPFPNLNGCTVEVWEWISNFTPHFTGGVITYPCWD